MSGAPIIICPYLHPEDAEKVRRAFGLEEPRGRKLEFFLWQDREHIGPEHAFQHCWSQFPDRDVIIVHPDMSPLPDDIENAWYDRLLDYGEEFPGAGALACDLFYPHRLSCGSHAVQSGGGVFVGGLIKHVHGKRMPYDRRFRWPRKVAWATFGGILLRRRALEVCGGFDARYSWAYVMDVDYSLEMRQRGFEIWQVPVNLLHEESTSTKAFLEQEAYQEKVQGNHQLFREKWKDSALLEMGSEFATAEILFLDSLQAESTAQQISGLESLIEGMHSSLSWRLTAPLRAVHDLITSSGSKPKE
jgi:hypothetical protein